MSFRIVFENPSPQTEPPVERFEGYDLNDALYDYLHEGVRVELVLDDARWATLDGYLAAYMARELFKIADLLLGLPDAGDQSRAFADMLEDLPPGSKVYSTVIADWDPMPLLAFATDGTDVWIHQRCGTDRSRWSVHRLPRRDVLDQMRVFLTRLLDELVASFSFLRGEPIYEYWRARLGDIEALAAIPGPHSMRPDPDQWRKDAARSVTFRTGLPPNRPEGDTQDDPRAKAALDDLVESWKACDALVAAAAKDDEKA